MTRAAGLMREARGLVAHVAVQVEPGPRVAVAWLQPIDRWGGAAVQPAPPRALPGASD